MRIGRIQTRGSDLYGIVQNNVFYHQNHFERSSLGIETFLDGNLEVKKTHPIQLSETDFTWLPPIARPGKILCIGQNYREHSLEQGKEPESTPLIFSKFSTSLVGHLSSVPFPPHTNYLDYEVELAVVIGKKCRKIQMDEDPLSYVFGYTVANDLTARDVQKSEKQWTRGKGFDASLPIGPTITTHNTIKDPSNLEIWLTVNGDKRQLSNTSKMIFSVSYLIRYISQVITLQPGDILLTGTPEGVGYYMEPKKTLQRGDQIACGVTSVGELRFQISDSKN